MQQTSLYMCLNFKTFEDVGGVEMWKNKFFLL